MIWMGDFACLDERYLKEQFRPWEHGISAETMALSLRGSNSALVAHLLQNMDAGFATQVASHLYSECAADADSVRAAQEILVKSYLWEIVYWKFPEAYDAFSKSQEFPFELLIPSDLISGATVVDVGCGTGKLTAYLARYASRTIAIDPCLPLLELCRRRFEKLDTVTVTRGSFSRLPLSDASADVVTSCMAFQHNEERGGKGGLISMRRIVRRGGEIRLIVGSCETESFLLQNDFKRLVGAPPLSWNPVFPSPLDANALVAQMLRSITERYALRQVAGADREAAGVSVYVWVKGVRAP